MGGANEEPLQCEGGIFCRTSLLLLMSPKPGESGICVFSHARFRKLGGGDERGCLERGSLPPYILAVTPLALTM